MGSTTCPGCGGVVLTAGTVLERRLPSTLRDLVERAVAQAVRDAIRAEPWQWEDAVPGHDVVVRVSLEPRLQAEREVAA